MLSFPGPVLLGLISVPEIFSFRQMVLFPSRSLLGVVLPVLAWSWVQDDTSHTFASTWSSLFRLQVPSLGSIYPSLHALRWSQLLRWWRWPSGPSHLFCSSIPVPSSLLSEPTVPVCSAVSPQFSQSDPLICRSHSTILQNRIFNFWVHFDW